MDVIHLGANKTASTLLQRKLFLELEDRFFIGEESNSFGNVSGNEFISSIIYSNSDELNASETYQCIQNKIFTCKNQRIPIILSSEDLISYGNQSLNAHRLQMLLPQANILLIIRNQIESILSWYISHGSRLRNVPQDYWQRYVAPEQAVDFLLNFPQFTIERSFNYLGIYKIYSDLFGKDRVFCVPYELLNLTIICFFQLYLKL